MCQFLDKNLSDVVHPVWILDNCYCHNVSRRCCSPSCNVLLKYTRTTQQISLDILLIMGNSSFLLYYNLLLNETPLKCNTQHIFAFMLNLIVWFWNFHWIVSINSVEIYVWMTWWRTSYVCKYQNAQQSNYPNNDPVLLFSCLSRYGCEPHLD